jgi:hypothetical protein
MENLRSRREGWSAVSKGSLVGAFASPVLSVVIHVVIGLRLVDQFGAAVMYFSLGFPTACLYAVLGWGLPLTSGHKIGLGYTLAVVAVNSVVLAVLGGVVGLCTHFNARRSKKKDPGIN